MSMSDIKGNIPKFVLTMGVGQITQTMQKLIEILDKMQTAGTIEGEEEY
jgi:flagellar basal body P-ring protein FlgI